MNSRTLLACLLLLPSAACRKDPSPFDITNLNNNTISAFGHAGMGLAFKYPTNSYESIEACLRIGADGTEWDVQLTSDSVLVLYHDGGLESGTSMHGTVNGHTWAELSGCVYASPLSATLHLQRVDDLLAQFRDSTRIFTFDCKLYNRPGSDYQAFVAAYARALLRLIRRYGLEDLAFIESGDRGLLQLLQAADPRLKLFIYPESFGQGLATADGMNLFGITIDNNQITADELKRAHEHGRRVTLWGVQTEEDNIAAIRKSPDYIQSDKLIHLLRVFDGYRKQGWKNLQW